MTDEEFAQRVRDLGDEIRNLALGKPMNVLFAALGTSLVTGIETAIIGARDPATMSPAERHRCVKELGKTFDYAMNRWEKPSKGRLQ